MVNNLKRYWNSTTANEKLSLIANLKEAGLADESIRKYALVKGVFPLKYWRIIVNHSSLSIDDLYHDWESSNRKS